VFDAVARKARIGRNPKNPAVTGQIPPKKTVRFRPGKELKSAVSKLSQIQ
jgi:nucleoid DNA-binding protein